LQRNAFALNKVELRHESRSESSELNEEEDGDVVYIVKKKGPEVRIWVFVFIRIFLSMLCHHISYGPALQKFFFRVSGSLHSRDLSSLRSLLCVSLASCV
jgi:hypothetical protein